MKEGTQRWTSVCFTRWRCLVCDLIPEFMSFVSLDCTYTGSKIDHMAHRSFYFLFLLPVCIYISIYIQYILTDLMLMGFPATQQLVRLFTVSVRKCDFWILSHQTFCVFIGATTRAFSVAAVGVLLFHTCWVGFIWIISFQLFFQSNLNHWNCLDHFTQTCFGWVKIILLFLIFLCVCVKDLLLQAN